MLRADHIALIDSRFNSWSTKNGLCDSFEVLFFSVSNSVAFSCVHLSPLVLFSCLSTHTNVVYPQASSSVAAPLPEFPKPAAVLAAEERERKRKERESGIAEVSSAADLQAQCYGLTKKTCALLAVTGGASAASDALKVGVCAAEREGVFTCAFLKKKWQEQRT